MGTRTWGDPKKLDREATLVRRSGEVMLGALVAHDAECGCWRWRKCVTRLRIVAALTGITEAGNSIQSDREDLEQANAQEDAG